MNPQQSQLLASLAFLVADDKTASTFDQLAYWGSSKPQGTTAHTVSEQWLKARAFSSVASLLTQTQQAASTADVKRVETILRISEYIKTHPRASETEKARFIQSEIEAFAKAISKKA
eukprot:m.118250 g.118250  ORF g.118250 m.118250 type:complete len:117 (-) comp15446_c0_seq4:3167-3517(-)